MNLIRTTALSLVLALGLHMAQAAPSIEDESRTEAMEKARSTLKNQIEDIIINSTHTPTLKFQHLQALLNKNELSSAAFYLDANKRSVGQWILNKNTDALLGYLYENELDLMIHSTSIFEELYANIFAKKTAAAKEEKAKAFGAKVLEGAGVAAGGATLDEDAKEALQKHFETLTKEKDAKIDELEEEKRTKTETIGKFERDMETERARVTKLEQELAEARTTHDLELEQKEKEITEVDTEHKTIQNEQRTKIAELEGQIKKLEDQLTAAKADAGAPVKDELDAVKDALDKATKELEASKAAVIKQTQDHRATIAALEDEKAGIQEALNELEKELKTSKATLSEKEKKVLELETNIQTLGAQKASADAETQEDLKLLNETLAINVVEAEKKAKEAEGKVAKLEEEIQALKATATDGSRNEVQADLDKAQRELTAAQAKLTENEDAHKAEKTRLEGEKIALTEERDLLKANLAAATARAAAPVGADSKELENAKQTIKAHAAALDDLGKQNKALQDTNAALKADLDAQKKDLDTLRANAEAAAKTTEQTQTQVPQLEAQLTAQTQRLAQLEKVEEENKALKARVDEIAELERRVNELKTLSEATKIIPTTKVDWELFMGKKGVITKAGMDFLKRLRDATLKADTESPSSPKGEGAAGSNQ
ncbi:MAG: hypothetical protein ACK5PQ_05130 [Alphaproteobacteria bacterium]